MVYAKDIFERINQIEGVEMMEIVQQIVFVTMDGEKFDKRKDAEIHQMLIDFEGEYDKIRIYLDYVAFSLDFKDIADWLISNKEFVAKILNLKEDENV